MKNIILFVPIVYSFACGTDYQFAESKLANRNVADQELLSKTDFAPETPDAATEPESQVEMDVDLDSLTDEETEEETTVDAEISNSPIIVIIDKVTGSEDSFSQNLLINGDFSYPQLDKYWDLFHNSEMDQDLFGWQYSFTSQNPCGSNFETMIDGSWIELQRHNGGNQIAELDSHCANGVSKSEMDTNLVIKQSVDAIDGIYEVKFRHKARQSPTGWKNILKFSINEKIIPVNSINSWQTKSVFIQAENIDELTLAFEDIGESDTYGILLDDISIRKID